MLSICGAGEDSWESCGLWDQTSQSWRKPTLNIHWKDWCWSWSSNTLVTWCKELTHWKRTQCWVRLKAKGEDGDRGWVGWLDSIILNGHEFEQILGNSKRQMSLVSMGLQRVGHDSATEQNYSGHFLVKAIRQLDLLDTLPACWLENFISCHFFLKIAVWTANQTQVLS